ncbi:MAG: porin family protein [Bacteroidales bacterium]|nr:porin family protein [Bacteroidales bacterium]
MKRLVTLIMAIVAFSAPGFCDVDFGVEGGAIINKMKFNKNVFQSDNRAGFFIGPKLKSSLVLGFGLDAALLYSQRSTEFGLEDSDLHSKDFSYITVPVNIRWQLGSDRFAPYIATGPQWDFYIGNSKLNTSDGIKATFEHNVISWNIGAGLMLLDHVQIGFSWNLPITDRGNISFKDLADEAAETVKAKMKNKEWNIRVNYYF